MAELFHEGNTLRIVLVDGEANDSAPIISDVRQALSQDHVAIMLIEVPEHHLRNHVVNEVMVELEREARDRKIDLRFKV